jgi:cobyrinic acid a,c-diamide synthase
MSVPRIMIAGSTSGVGKTTIAVAIMHAMKKRGLKVQPFKVGPDFIDPSYHTFITGRQSRNLDAWMMREKGVLESFQNACSGADVAVIEGVMGLFDGMSGKDDFASSAHIARTLDAPIILVLDAAKTARSIAAIALGFMHFDKRLKIVGIIVNNVASDRHAGYVTDAMSENIRAPVLGVVRRNPQIKIEERHLGLVPAQELAENTRKEIVEYAKYVQDHIDIDKILQMCRKSPLPRPALKKQDAKVARIAVALDESFNFYYADNLDALRLKGAELVFFSPVNDRKLPDDVDGIILGGGFPEVLADRLEKNRQMIKSIVKAAGRGMPIYGECGGLMYMTRSISGYKGERHARKMMALVDADTVMTSKLTLSYTEADCNGPIFGRTHIRGHEFHYSLIDNISSDSKFAYFLSKGRGIKDFRDGFVVGSTGLAAYMHLHFASSKLAERLVSACTHHRRC